MATANDLKDEFWRLNNLYWIKDKNGKKVKFSLNKAQLMLYKGLWYLNVILKARQLGVTTFIQLFMLDRCLFNSNINAGVIAHNREDAQKFFRDKIKFAYDNLPSALKERIPATNDAVGELSFANGSSIRVGTSLRSGTYQYLHISEYGKICAKYPEKAEEIKTGSLNTVGAGQFVFIESTAEGDFGSFYDLCQEYKDFPDDQLTSLDYKFFFLAWFYDPEYTLDANFEIPADLQAYFINVERELGIELTKGQKAWYAKKKITQKSKMKQEYPSTPDEAFEQISEFAVYGKELGKVIEEGRLCDLPVKASKPVDLFFDIGKSTKAETTSVWFGQNNDPWFDWVDYYQNQLKPVGVYVREIKSKGYNLGKWYIPHDADNQKDFSMKTFRDRLINAGISDNDIIVVPRVDHLKTGIDMVKDEFPIYRFDQNRTKEGWKAIKAYHHEWNEKKAVVGEPVHDWSSHPADALRQKAQGYVSVHDEEEDFDIPAGVGL